MNPIIVTMSILTILATHANAVEIHVSTSGNDANTGTSTQPFASLAKARDAARSARQANPAGSVTILLHGGTYRLNQSLALDARDSGTAITPVIWQTAGDGEVIVSGGYQLPSAALRPVTDATTLARLPADRDKALQLFEIDLARVAKEFPALEPRGMPTPYENAWPELFSNGKPLPLSAWPNGAGYAKGFKPTKIISSGTTSKVNAGGAAASGNTAAGNSMTFGFTNERVSRWRNAMTSYNADVWMGGHWFWDWADDLLPVTAIDAGGIITIGRRHSYGIGPHVNLHVYNLVEEMDTAGEYAVEPSGKRMLVLLSGGQAAQGLTPRKTPPSRAASKTANCST